jgi:hypothetical protein
MDVFKFNNGTTFQDGEAVTGYDTISWTERYREPGSFEIGAKLSAGLKDHLPLGTIISHVNTLTPMIVENHQITDAEDIDPFLTVSGRSFSSILEHRIVTQEYDWAANLPPSNEDTEYILAANDTWIQAVELINDHIRVGHTFHSDDAIANVIANHSVGIAGTSEERIMGPDTVLNALIQILDVDDLGCRAIRPHTFTGYPQPGTNIVLTIHDGVDRRDRVVFSPAAGDIAAAEYLWSDKRLKTSALIVGKFVSMIYHGTPTGINRRVLLVDGSDIDGRHETIPTSTTLTTIRTRMETRGKQALKAARRLVLARTDISETPTHIFRKDYNIGDIVSIDSPYGPNIPMRVVEYVEIEDENGASSHPTLAELQT